MKYLGDTLEKIACEKAGIAKPGTPFVIGERDPALVEVLRREARTGRGAGRRRAARADIRVLPPEYEWTGPLGLAGPAPAAERRRGPRHPDGPAGALPAAARRRRARLRARAWIPGRLDRRGQVAVRRRPQSRRHPRADRGAREHPALPRPLHGAVSILGDKEWPEMLVELDRVIDRGVLTVAPTAASRGWDAAWLRRWLARARPAAGAGRVDAGAGLRRGARHGAAGRRDHPGDRLVPHRRRRDGRARHAASERAPSAGASTTILPMQTKALPGFRDFYPADLALRAHIFGTWRAVAARYGFEEYDGPPLEPLELYTAKSGDEIVGQLYTFTDKGGREVALRPEMTPTLARMVAARANGLKKPIRWFSIPQLFRYERQQRGRLREHFQLNCDLIGESGPLGDAEIIALAVDVDARLRARPGRRARAALRPPAAPRRCSGRWASASAQAGGGVSGGRQARAGRPRRRSAEQLSEAGLATAADRPGARARAGRGAGTSSRRAPLRDRARRLRPGAPLRRDARTRSTPWVSATSSMSTSASCAGWRTTPARCSSCSTPGRAARHLRRRPLRQPARSARRRGPAGARLRHGRRGAGRAAPRARAGAGRRPDVDVFLAADRRATTSRSCSRLAHELRDAGLRVEYALAPRRSGSSSSWPTPRGAGARS